MRAEEVMRARTLGSVARDLRAIDRLAEAAGRARVIAEMMGAGEGGA